MPTTADAVIKAAASIARDAAEGRLAPTDLEATAVAECRKLFSTVAGPDDPLWPLHVDIARQVLALDGVPTDELAEWLAVARQRAGKPVSRPDAGDTPADSGPAGSDAQSPGAVETEAKPDAEAVVSEAADAATSTSRGTATYDPLAHWQLSLGLRRSL